MPTYEYRCEKCGQQFEVFQSFKARPLRSHPQCGGAVEKVFHPRGIVFKGSGFYVNDSRSKSPSEASGNGSSSESAKPTEKSASKEKSSTTTSTTKDG